MNGKNGVNLQPSYYNNGNVTFGWDLMKRYPQIKSLRIEIEPDYVNMAYDWIRQASDHGYHIIATYHKYQVILIIMNRKLIVPRSYHYLITS